MTASRNPSAGAVPPPGPGHLDAISPLDGRYPHLDAEAAAALSRFLSEEASIRYQVLVERALLAELEARGVAPRGSSAAFAEIAASVSPAEVYAEERRIGHNVRALVNCVRARLAPEFRGCVHLFATSNDVTDTARAAALRDVTREVVLPEVASLALLLADWTRAHADTPQIGRTHGRYAEPITLGYWLANHLDRLGRRLERIVAAAAELRGKLAGAVGSRSALALRWPGEAAEVERSALARLGLRPSDHSAATQVVHPEYVLDYAHALVSALSVAANVADDFRHLMRSEVEEIRQKDDPVRVGSSTMPHKVNPADFENVTSFWKAFLPRVLTVYLDQVSLHQRDLTNSASMRFLVEIVAGLVYAARRLREAISRAEANPAALRAHLERAAPDIIAEPLYIALALAGERDPYETSKRLRESAKARGQTLLEFLRATSEGRAVLARLDPRHREVILHPETYVGDAPERARAVCEHWEKRLRSPELRRALERPDEAQTLVAGG
jgi:adenylosuccinate lyase